MVALDVDIPVAVVFWEEHLMCTARLTESDGYVAITLRVMSSARGLSRPWLQFVRTFVARLGSVWLGFVRERYCVVGFPAPGGLRFAYLLDMATGW